MMNKRVLFKFLIRFFLTCVAIIVVGFAIVSAIAWYIHSSYIAVLEPAGLIAAKERGLFILIAGLSLIVIIPVFVLTIFIAWKYREGNTTARYTPDWDYKPLLDIIWWVVPTVLIVVFSVITWQSTKELDPYKPIVSSSGATPITIQVIALDWKWLFIYPDQNIATVNFFQFPENTPINFEITSDAPMNSFWIPALGSQIYAMPSMTTQLHLIASTTGSFDGYSANISGAGFAGMTFVAKSSSQADFDAWVTAVRQSANPLSVDAYNTLAKPSSNNPVAYYSWKADDLYDKVLMKDMMEAEEVAPVATSTSTPTATMDPAMHM